MRKPYQSNWPGLTQRIGRALGIQGEAPSLVDDSLSPSIQVADLTDHQYLWTAGQVTTWSAGGQTPAVAATLSAAILRAPIGTQNQQKIIRVRTLYLSGVGVSIRWGVFPIGGAVPLVSNTTTPTVAPRDGRMVGAAVPIMGLTLGTAVTGASGAVVDFVGGTAYVIPLNISLTPLGAFYVTALQNNVPFFCAVDWDERDATELEMT